MRLSNERHGVLRALAATLALAISAPSSATTINTDWRIIGDGPARPVQVFDDGVNVYVQVRDPSRAPAPLGPSGPLDYTMRGHYLVLPMASAFRLQLGESVVEVTSGTSTSTRRLPPGVASITTPVEASDRSTPSAAVTSPVSADPSPQPRPMAGYVPTRVQVASGPAVSPQSISPAPAVTGEIVVGGRADPIAIPATNRERFVTNDASDGEINRVLVGIPASTPVVVQADGTVRGATTARRVKDACQRLGRACEVSFRGAPQGRVTVETRK
jgi:hypothetical protein